LLLNYCSQNEFSDNQYNTVFFTCWTILKQIILCLEFFITILFLRNHTWHNRISIALLDQGLVSGCNFISGVLLARSLGVEKYGVFSLAWMAILFFSSIQNSLIISPMMSIGAKKLYNPSEYFGAVFLHQLIFSCISFFLILIGVALSNTWFVEWQLAKLGLPLAFCSISFQLQDFARRYFFTVERETTALLNDSISYFSQIFLLTILSNLTLLNTANAIWVVASTSLLAALVGISAFGHMHIHLSIARDIAKRHWHFSRWLTASTLMQWTSWNFFVIVGSTQMGPVAAGAIRATQNIIGVTHIMFQGLANVVPIQAAKTFHKNGTLQLQNYLVKVAIWGGTTTAVFCIIVAYWAEFWLRLLYGNEYLNYGFILRWWSLSYFLIFFGVPLTSGLRALENTRPLFISYSVITIFSLSTAAWIVKYYGLHGAMAGVFCAQLLLQATLLFCLRQILKNNSASGVMK